MAKDRKVCETPASKAALDRLTQRLAAAASDKPMPARVVLLDWSLVNAFAVPGGQIILTRGLVQRAGSSDEVAGVLAHELGHTLELHPEAGIIRALGLAAATQLAFAGSQGTVSNIGLVLTQLRYTRIAEREADAHALRMLKGAGISAKGFGDFFERLEGKKPGEEKNGKDAGASDLAVILQTHPATADRIAMVRAQPTYPATAALSDEDWRALREACGPPAVRPATPAPPVAASTPGPTTGPTTSRPPTSVTPTPTPTPPITVRPDTEAAREIAEATKALGANPNDVAALQKRARAYTKENRHELALGDYAKAAELKPDDAALHYGRGTSLQNLRRYEEASARLRRGLAAGARPHQRPQQPWPRQPGFEALRRGPAGLRRAGPDPARLHPRLFQSRPGLPRHEPQRGGGRATSTPRWRGTRATPPPTPAAAWPTRRWARATRPSRTSARRSPRRRNTTTACGPTPSPASGSRRWASTCPNPWPRE